MKKFFTLLAILLIGSVGFSQSLSALKTELNAKKGDSIPAFAKGQVIYAQKDASKVKKSDMSIPEELSDGVVILNYEETYYYNGEQKTKVFQMIYSNVEPTKKFAKATKEKPIDAEWEETICIAKGTPSIIIRDLTVDPYLTSVSKATPLEIGAYWYFDIQSRLSNNPKYLIFQPITSKEDVIVFTDGTEASFKEILEKSKDTTVAALDIMPIRIKTVMKNLPQQKPKITDAAEKKIHLQYMSNMNLEVVVNHLGYKIHLYFPANFEQYFKDEYKLGDPIWFYGNTLYVKNGELHLYGRDFTLEDVESKINDLQNAVILQNRMYSNNNQSQEEKQNQSDYVDMTVKLPKGGYITYERFFFASDGKIFNENTTNISENYYDAQGRLIARTMRYNGTTMIRNTSTYKYDDKGRQIEECYYDSKMYQEGGNWKVDPKQSRLFIKDTTTYEEKQDAIYAVTVRNRYNYFPQTEHPDLIINKTYNKNNILIHYEEKDIAEQTVNEVSDYDDFGNEIYSRYDTEKPYEYKTEYVYDGNKIVTATKTDLKTKKTYISDYVYDEKGNLAEIKTRGTKNRVEYKYNKNGKVIEISNYDDNGQLSFRNTIRYDKKTGLTVLKIEETYFEGILIYARFWYYETKADGWKSDLDPWELAEKLKD